MKPHIIAFIFGVGFDITKTEVCPHTALVDVSIVYLLIEMYPEDDTSKVGGFTSFICRKEQRCPRDVSNGIVARLWFRTI